MHTLRSIRSLSHQCWQSLEASKSLSIRHYGSVHPLQLAFCEVGSVQGRSSQRRALSKMTKKQEAHQYQAGSSTERDIDQWKHREPYRVRDKAENFDVKWEGQCHCGKVQYQLSREKPLAAKYCHCTTCQRLHGVSDTSQRVVHRDHC